MLEFLKCFGCGASFVGIVVAILWAHACHPEWFAYAAIAIIVIAVCWGIGFALLYDARR